MHTMTTWQWFIIASSVAYCTCCAAYCKSRNYRARKLYLQTQAMVTQAGLEMERNIPTNIEYAHSQWDYGAPAPSALKVISDSTTRPTPETPNVSVMLEVEAWRLIIDILDAARLAKNFINVPVAAVNHIKIEILRSIGQ